jgi:hypothetical protein
MSTREAPQAYPPCHRQFRRPRESDTSVAPEFELIVDVWARPKRSFAERRLDAEPHGPDEAGYNNRDDGLECIALRLFDASAPPPQVLKIRLKLNKSLGHARFLA